MDGFRPEGWPAVIPRLFTPDVRGLATFVAEVFGGVGQVRTDAPVEMRIGESMVMISDGGGLRQPSTAFLYVYVTDADDACARAMGLGAAIVEAPLDTAYGDRRATVRDPWGNTWQIATRRPPG